MTRAAAYHRASTRMQDVSLEDQETRVTEFATANGLMIEPQNRYVDIDSGSDRLRPELMKLIDAARRREFSVVLVDKHDRWVRDANYKGWLAVELQRAGCRVQYCNKQYSADIGGRIHEAVDGIFAETELDYIAERTSNALKERLKQGKHHRFGPCVFGFIYEEVDDKTSVLVAYEPEARIVRRVFTLCAEGWSSGAIARLLNEEGCPPPSASTVKRYGVRAACWGNGTRAPVWGFPTICNMLRDPVYRGERVLNRQKSTKREQHNEERRAHCRYRPKSEHITLPCPRLVEDQMWYAAQATLDGRKSDRTRNQHRPILLRGRVNCGLCGRPMTVDFSAAGTPAFRCSGRKLEPDQRCGAGAVPVAPVTEEVWSRLGTALTEPERVIEELKQQADRGPDPTLAADLERCRAAIATEARRVARFVALLGSDSSTLPVDEITRQMDTAQREKVRLEQEAGTLEKRLRQHALKAQQQQSLIDHLVERSLELMTLDFDGQRKLIEDFGVTARVIRPTEENSSGIVDVSMSIGVANTGRSTRIHNADEVLTITLPVAA